MIEFQAVSCDKVRSRRVLPTPRRPLTKRGQVAMAKSHLTLIERLFQKIEYDTNGGCWLWAGPETVWPEPSC